MQYIDTVTLAGAYGRIARRNGDVPSGRTRQRDALCAHARAELLRRAAEAARNVGVPFDSGRAARWM